MDVNKLRQENAQQKEQIAELKHQLDWFKRQLFGRKSEKQIVDNPYQDSLFKAEKTDQSTPPETEVKAHKRKNSTARSGDEINETGLRFDETVPQKIIEMAAPELQGESADQYEIIGYKDTTRLAQQPGSYTVLIYRRPVVRQLDAKKH